VANNIEQNRNGRVLADFGAAPGSGHTTATIGIRGMTTDTDVNAFIVCVATDDHSAEEVALESIDVRAVPTTDLLTLHVFSTNNNNLTGTYYVAWSF
jgi:hypothetical protein